MGAHPWVHCEAVKPYHLLFVAPLLALSACASSPGRVDGDGDGAFPPADCDDNVASTAPGAQELCDGVDNDCDGYVDEDFDQDVDGYKACGGQPDCDDAAPESYPGAPELCDGEDNDCDGAVDNGAEGSDDDGDGHCSSTDCDDGDPAVHPGAEELSDGVDNDCDGVIDEGFDGDGDGFGVVLDCDDDDDTIHPDAVESCDAVDQDCDGVVDNGFDADGDGWTTCGPDGHAGTPDDDCVDIGADAAAIHPEAVERCNEIDDNCDGNVDEGTQVDLDGDGWEACGGDCDDSDPTVYEGAFEGPDGRDNDCDGVVDGSYLGETLAAAVIPQGTSVEGRLGDRLSAGGDFNGDGLTDIAAAAPTHAGARGRVYLYLGASYGVQNAPAVVSAALHVTGAVPDDYLGWGLDLGDVNGDGLADLLVGMPAFASSTPPPGKVYVFFGSTTPPTGALPLSAADVVISGSFSTEQCGTAVAAVGDVNGDGLGDLAFTCPFYDPGGAGIVGRTALFWGRSSWPSAMGSADADATFVGGADDHQSGQAVAGLGDFNDDGVDDFAIGSTEWDGNGRVAVRFGSPTGWQQGESLDAADRLWSHPGSLGEDLGAWLGAGDRDEDGVPDLLIGMPAWSMSTGRVLVMTGGSNPVASGDAMPTASLAILGPAINASVGRSTAIVDLDGDGHGDLLTAAPGWGGGGLGERGRLDFVPGPLGGLGGPVDATTLSVAHWMGEQGDYFGAALSPVEDFNGDGAPDLVVSAPFHGSNNEGRLYVVPGFP